MKCVNIHTRLAEFSFVCVGADAAQVVVFVISRLNRHLFEDEMCLVFPLALSDLWRK